MVQRYGFILNCGECLTYINICTQKSTAYTKADSIHTSPASVALAEFSVMALSWLMNLSPSPLSQ